MNAIEERRMIWERDLSYLDDKVQLIDESGEKFEAYTLNIMPLQVPLIQYLNNKFERMAQPYKKKI